MVRKSVLYGVKGLSENKADKMIEAAKKMYPGANWMTGTAAAVQRERSIARITVSLRLHEVQAKFIHEPRYNAFA